MLRGPGQGSLWRSSRSGLRLGVNDGRHALGPNLSPEVIRVIPRVADEGLAAGVLEQLACCNHLVTLARSQRDVDRSASAINQSVELG